jgi:hypothetical protein
MGRTSIILGGVALVLLAFIVFFERGSVSTTEREGRKGQILESFVRDRVTRIEIQRKGVTTVLVREEAKPDEMLDGTGFRVEKPYAAEADRDAVESLLGALEWITPRRSLGEASAKDLSQFGFDKPRYRVTFTAGRDHRSFSIGAPSGDGSGAYLQTGDDRLAYLVGKDLVEALDHDPVYFHTKALHRGVSAYSVDKLRLRDAQGERVIEKRGDLYWLQGPEPVLASQPALVDIVNALDALKASRFVVEKPGNLEGYGLTAPGFMVAADSRSFSTTSREKNEGKREHLELRVGRACAGQTGESYVRADEGPVMCAADADLAKLKKPAAELRESRLCVLDDGQIRSVDLRFGKRELRVEEQGDGHRYRLLEDGKERESGTVDETALSDWFKSLRGARAEAFADDPSSVIGTPVATLTFERGKDKAAYEVRIGRAQGERVAVSRAGEKSIAWFGKGILPLVSASAVRFRKAKLLDLDPGAFVKLKTSGASRASEVVAKQGERYVLEQPAAAAGVQAERPTIDDIVRLIAKLEAVRFVAEAPSPEHGFAQPAFQVAVDFGGKQPQSHSLRVGAETDGGRFAQLDNDAAVFVLAPALARALDNPLVSRSALAVPLEELGPFELATPAGKLRVEPDAAGVFGLVTGQARDTARGQELARAVATLRAAKVLSYEKPAPEEGMDKPQLRVEVQPRPGSATSKGRTLLVGNPVGAEPTADLYARRTDMDVAFSVPRSVLDALAPQPTAAVKPQP